MPCFNTTFPVFSERIQENDLTSTQIPCVPNWTWHLFVCLNGFLNLSSVYTSWNCFCFFLPFLKKQICHKVSQWNGNYISSPFSTHWFRLKELHAATTLFSVLLGLVIIKYKILWLPWQFVMLLPSLHLFLYFLATKVFHKKLCIHIKSLYKIYFNLTRF